MTRRLNRAMSSAKRPIVPIVDLTDEAKASVELEQAFSTFGCCYLRGHGIDTAQESRVMNAAKAYFGLPEQVKEAYHRHTTTDGFVRGYIGIGAESGSEDLFEVKEGFSYGYEWDAAKPPTNPLQGPNVWPTELDKPHQRELQTFYTDMVGVSNALCRALSRALDKPPSYLGSYCTEGDTISIMRSFHYFPYSIMGQDGKRHRRRFLPHRLHALDKRDLSTLIGSSPHTDWGFLTLILQDEIGGLQLYHQDAWHDVPHIPGTVFVNGGDYLSLLTQKRWKSPIHRVVNHPTEERISMVLFYYPNFDAAIPVSASPSSSPSSLDKFNTLLDQLPTSSSSSELDVSFGAYICSKWALVQRST
ncbi:unnamed protein product [Aphanomyces euteiches]